MGLVAHLLMLQYKRLIAVHVQIEAAVADGGRGSSTAVDDEWARCSHFGPDECLGENVCKGSGVRV